MIAMILTEILPLLSFLLVIVGVVVGYFAIRTGLAKSEREISARIRVDLSEENNLLRTRVLRVEQENKRLNRVLELVIQTLKKTNRIDLEIDGDVITLRHPSGNVQVSRLSDNA